MPGINDKNFTEEEDMDQDTPESANSEDDDSELGTDSEGDDSSGKIFLLCFIAHRQTWSVGGSKF